MSCFTRLVHHSGYFGLVLLGLGLPTGCITPPGKPAATPNTLADADPRTAPAHGREANGSLAAIEEFLRRTDAYTLNPAALNGAKPPSPGHTASSGEPPITDVPQPSTSLHHASGLFPAQQTGRIRAPVSPPDSAPHKPNDAAVTNARVELGESAPPGRPAPALPALQSVAIAAAALPSRPESKSPVIDAAVANLSVEATPSAATESLHDRLRSLEEKVSATEDIDAEWQLRLMQLALHRDAEARELSPYLPEETRSLWRSLFDVVGVVRSATRNTAPLAHDALQQVDALRHQLSAKANPEVGSIHLCKRVITFGSFEEMAPEEFVAGRSIQTIVYSELRNIRFEETTGGLFRAGLTARLEILTPDGRSVWTRDEPQISDTCRRPRTDFFLAQRIVIPPSLPPGEYVLKLFVEDRFSSRAAEGATTLLLRPADSLVRK